jgi:hypothetical protein
MIITQLMTGILLICLGIIILGLIAENKKLKRKISEISDMNSKESKKREVMGKAVACNENRL